MTPSKFTYDPSPERPPSVVREQDIETGFIGKLQGLKYEYREDILDRDSLDKNFREKFEVLNRVHLTDSEFSRLLEEIISPDVFTAARTLRAMNSFTRDDGTPLNYTLVNNQVYQVKAIVECMRDNSGNGYIWSTIGSGNTFTSFKASTLLKDNPSIEKQLFVGEREALDSKTRDSVNVFRMSSGTSKLSLVA